MSRLSPSTLVLGLLRGYQRWISPMTPPSCRYYPSCSQYAVDAVHARGVLMGSAYAVRRLLRCHPWTAGGFDPAPSPPARSRRRTGAARSV